MTPVEIRAALAGGMHKRDYRDGRAALVYYDHEGARTEEEAQHLAEALRVVERFLLFIHALRYGFLRTGDVVHAQIATLVVAWADYGRGNLSWLGWPQGEVEILACAGARKATDEQHDRELERLMERSLGEPLTRQAVRLHRPALWAWIMAELDRLRLVAAPTPEQLLARARSNDLSQIEVRVLARAFADGTPADQVITPSRG